MRPGDVFTVSGLIVEKVTDVSWIVWRGTDAACVDEDWHEPPGYLGESWAVSAVLEAEQRADEAELNVVRLCVR